MKFLLVLLVLNLPLNLCAEKEAVRNVPTKNDDPGGKQDPLTIRALSRLEKRLNIKFNIPFPDNFDPDAYLKRPIALWEVGISKVCVTKPIVNPYDEPRTVEWMVGPTDPKQLAREGFECAIDLDDHGDFTRLNVLAGWASDGGCHYLDRDDSESDAVFFERARLTFQARAQKAKDPVAAILYLTAFEKMASTIQTLRKEEARAVPGENPK